MGRKKLPSMDACFTLLGALLLQGWRETAITVYFKGGSHCSASPYPNRKETACCLVRQLPFLSSSKSTYKSRVGATGAAPCLQHGLLIMFHSKEIVPT